MTERDLPEAPQPSAVEQRVWAMMERHSAEMEDLRESQKETSQELKEMARELKEAALETDRQLKEAALETDRLITRQAKEGVPGLVSGPPAPHDLRRDGLPGGQRGRCPAR